MRDLLILIVHFITTVIRLAKPCGLLTVVTRIRSGNTSVVDREPFASARPIFAPEIS
jgi:hypothetical protein